MAFDTQHVTAATLTGVARGTFTGIYSESLVSTYLPPVDNPGITFQFTPNESQLIKAAMFRSWGAESDQAAFNPKITLKGELPPISRRHEVDEYTHLQQLSNSTSISSSTLIAEAFEKHAAFIAAQIATRLIEGAAEGIETGKMTINERGLEFEIDYGRRPDLTKSLATKWSDPTADVIADLIMLRAAYGGHPGEMLTSYRIMAFLSRNASIVELALQTTSSGLTSVTPEDVRSVLAGFGFPNVTINDERLIDHTGNERNLFSPDKVLFLPKVTQLIDPLSQAGPLGTLQLGITSEALEPSNGLGKSAGLAAGAIKIQDPNGYNILASAIGLPVISRANDTAAMTVI